MTQPLHAASMFGVARREAQRPSASYLNMARATPEAHCAPGHLACALATAGIQPKLKLDQPGDEYEQEADAIADQVMRSARSEPTRELCRPGGAPGLSYTATADNSDSLHRRASGIGEGSGELTSDVESGIRSQSSAGQPLPGLTRAFFEPRFGRDFGGVRLHTGPDSVQLTNTVDALAFTHGSHVWLGPGIGPQPSHVLAHELAHVVQQTSAQSGEGNISRPDNKFQRYGTQHSAVGQLMRHAGSRALSSYLQRQPVPAPAPAVGPPPAPTLVGPTSAEENAPVTLPASGGLKVVFSSGGQMRLELNDLSEFGFGEGKLETPPIPVGEFITVSAAIGSHNPITLIQPTLTLSPVIGSISAEEVAKNKSAEAKLASERTGLGTVAAALGGIGGGIVGIIGGAALGSVALGPLGTGPGAIAGAKFGAEQGGLAAGKTAESVFNLFRGDFDVTAILDSGNISGRIGLHYTPFIRLSLGAEGFEWLASISAELLTALNLTASAMIDLAGSNVTLHFRDGTLVRTIFTLAPSATLSAALEAEARLKLTGSFLNILEESAGRGAGLLSLEYTTQPFPLFKIDGMIGASTEFEFSKGSRMEVLSKRLTAAKDATRGQLIAGLRASGPSLPFLKRRAALDEMSRTGLSEDEAILMQWHKPWDWYPDYLYRPSTTGRAQKIAKFPHMIYDNGFEAGVDDWPYIGKTLRYRGGDEPRGAGVRKFTDELKEEGIELEDDLAYKADIDHVIDWAFSGNDDSTNLWPLERSANRSAGTTQNLWQLVWWAESRGRPPQRTRIGLVPPERWFEIAAIRSSGGIHG